MVVSAILTTTLAPITGALFGASYGTAIRIGYEIIFPALFGDVINEQKNNPTKLQEEGSKRTIEAMHKMFTGVGGASAMEFGIEQGIAMAKKKTESPDVQTMIDLSLGLTQQQLNKRGKSAQFQDPTKDIDTFPDVQDFTQSPGDVGNFRGMTLNAILTFFRAITGSTKFVNNLKLLDDDANNAIQVDEQAKLRQAHTFAKAIYLEKWGAKPDVETPIQDAPTSSDAEFQIWLAELTKHLQLYLSILNMSAITYTKMWNRASSIGTNHQRNHIADLKKKLVNFITISKNRRDLRINAYIASFKIPV